MNIKTILLSFTLLNPVFSAQLKDVRLISPIVNKPFIVSATNIVARTKDKLEQAGQKRVTFSKDLGIDDDGCYHTKGVNNYSDFIATCPYSYFSALVEEWNTRNGRLMTPITKNFKNWLTSKDGFNTELVSDRNRIYKQKLKAANSRKTKIPDFMTWQLEQSDIPVHKKYRFALACYEQRDARPIMIAKVALSGSWAIRANLSDYEIMDNAMQSGRKEVNDKLDRNSKMKEENKKLLKSIENNIPYAFNFKLCHEVYSKIFKSRLSDEGYIVAGLAHFGFTLRMGDLRASQEILDKIKARLKTKDYKHAARFRGIIRERKTRLDDYVKMMNIASTYFIKAIEQESIVRKELPTIMLATAECLLRAGNEHEAMNWYLTVANMDETRKSDRETIKAMGKVPAVKSNNDPMLMGWKADEKIEMLKKKGLVHTGKISGPYNVILNAILYKDLGSPTHVNPHWNALTTGSYEDVHDYLKDIGRAIIRHKLTRGEWPETLGQLWTNRVIADWNDYNRFCCPVTGTPLIYTKPKNTDKIDDKIVVLSTDEAVKTIQGLKFGTYLLNNSVKWTDQ